MSGLAADLRVARRMSRSQLLARTRFLVLRRAYAAFPALPLRRAAAAEARPSSDLPRLPASLIVPDGLDAARERVAARAAGRFEFLGTARTAPCDAEGRASFDRLDWTDASTSPLWRYQLQYLETVRDAALTGRGDVARALLAAWTTQFGTRWHREAWHPYPASLRLVALCHAAAALGSFDELAPDGSAGRLIASHAAYLLRHLEHDVRGNHLLENARALCFAGRFLEGPLADECALEGRELLRVEVPEQILPDGGHFELAPMYHVIVLHRLLELSALLAGDEIDGAVLRPAIARATRFLRIVTCPDGDVPQLGDSARGFAPKAEGLLQVAPPDGGDEQPPNGLSWLPDTGLAVFRGRRAFAVFDAGPVCPEYLPAHGQADSFTVEAWFDGACVVADPGLHEYTGAERAWGRSSRAHSTVTIDERDSSEVFGSFRVGGRASVTVERTEPDSVTATLRPWDADAAVTRRVRGRADRLDIDDVVRAPSGAAVRARLLLHEDVSVRTVDGGAALLDSPRGSVVVRSQAPLVVEESRRSPRFGEIARTCALRAELEPGAGEPSRRANRFELQAVGAGRGTA